MNKRCWAVSWDHQYRVYAVHLEEVRGGSVRLLEHRSVVETGGDFADGLKKLLRGVALDEDEMVAVGGFLPGCAVVEQAMPDLPSRAMAEAVAYQLNDLFPGRREETVSAYWAVGSLPDGRRRVRIMAMRRDRLEKVTSELRRADLKSDLLLHPFMAAGSELDFLPLYLPGAEADCVFKPVSPDGLRRVGMLGALETAPDPTRVTDLASPLNLELPEELPLSGSYPAAVILGCAALKSRGSARSAETALLPAGLVRRRFRRLRHNIVYLSVLCLGVLIALMAKSWVQERDIIAEIDANIRNVEQALAEVRARREVIDRRRVVLRKFCESPNIGSDALEFLYQLTATLPDNMYVTSFAGAGERMSVTIIYSGERMGLLDLLGSIKGYKLGEDTKTTQNNDANKTSTAQVVWTKTAKGGR